MGDKKLTIIITIAAILGTALGFWIADLGIKETKKRDLKRDIPASVLEKTRVQPVYMTSDMNDSADVVIAKDTVSYWYVYYQFNNDYSGYKVIKLSTPYFTIKESVMAIKPNCSDNDFIGVQFFKRVPYETYKSYLDSKSN